MLTIPENVDCVEASAPGSRWFVWRAPQGRVHVMRATRSRSKDAFVTGSARPIPMGAVDLVLKELGGRKPAVALKWKPADAGTPRTIIARLPTHLSKPIQESEHA